LSLPEPAQAIRLWSGAADCGQDLRAALGAADAELAQRFDRGVPAAELVAARAWVVDQIVRTLWRPIGASHPRMAILAVGGYGRAELFPRSDVDLLVLVPEGEREPAQAAIEAFMARLWDTGLALGTAVRTVAETIEVARDLTVRTALLEARLLDGAPPQFDALASALAGSDPWSRRAFLVAKLAEQRARHARFHDTAHNLEPNLKDGPGGLRDYQNVLWLGAHLARAGTLAALEAEGLLEGSEASALAGARDTLWRIRFGLHRVAGRAEERLLFEHQRELARRFEFRDEHSQNLAVEQFMQGYYRAAMVIERIGERVVQRCKERVEGAPTRLELDADFAQVGNLLDVNDPSICARQPSAMLRAFWLLLEHPRIEGPSARLMVALDRHLAEVGTQLRDDPDALAVLLAILRHPGPVARVLKLMARNGVLGALLPAFGEVSGRMQFDLFHVYTVDQHTLTVLDYMDGFTRPEAAERFPLAHELMRRIRKPELLYLAGLFHDIAKGRGGDHSVLGSDDALGFCRRLGLTDADTDLVAWLVREHLALSVTAQKQDLTDPAVVHRFAERVQDLERLDYLYLLTVADINGTSQRLWNSWKDRLLGELYRATHLALSRGLENPVHAAERVAETRRAALGELQSLGFADGAVGALWSRLPEECFLRLLPEQLAWLSAVLLRNTRAPLPIVAIRRRDARGTSQVLVYSPDRDGLFACLTAVLDRCQLNVVEARIMGTRDGRALDLFQVLDHEGHALADEERAADVVARLKAALAPEELSVRPSRRTPSRSARQFTFAPQVVFAASADGARTQMALTAPDRPGLLAEIADALSGAGVRVHGARIATFGERAEDVFELAGSDDRALGDEACTALAMSLRERLLPPGEPAKPSASRENHVQS